jgi:hypothetical protein
MSDDLARDLQRSRDAWRLVAAGTSLLAIALMIGVMILRPAAQPAPENPAVAALLPPSGTVSAAGAGAASPATQAGSASAAPPADRASGGITEVGTGLERFSRPVASPLADDRSSGTELGVTPRRLALADGQFMAAAPPEVGLGRAQPAVQALPHPLVTAAAAGARRPNAVHPPGASAKHQTPAGSIASRADAAEVASAQAAELQLPHDPIASKEPPSGNFEARSAAVAEALAGLDTTLHGDVPSPRPRISADAKRHNAWQAPAAVTPATAVAARRSVAELMRDALDLERSGNLAAASQLYRTAANQGNGAASLRLAELFLEGGNDLKRDYVAAVHWYSKAREQGADVPPLEKH